MNKRNKIFFLAALLCVFGLGVALKVSAQESTVSFTVRSGSQVGFDAPLSIIEVVTPGEQDIIIQATDSGTGEAVEKVVSPNSVFGFLARADKASSDLTLSAIQYFAYFDSLFLKCAVVGTEEGCDNWQYVVDNVYPSVGMDAFELEGGEQVYVYFGSPHQLVLPKDTLGAGDSFEIAAQDYQYESNQWSTLSGVTIGILRENPDDPWNPIELKTQAVDVLGKSVFEGLEAGTYLVGIKEDFYFPPVQLAVEPAPSSGSGGGGGGTLIYPKNLDVEKAVAFLLSFQEEDGSILSPFHSDWAALALAVFPGEEEAKATLSLYLSRDVSPGTLATDYERRAMALMALGINPYGESGTNYIQNILDSFDGEQIGSPDLVNDDIFGLLVLLKAGVEGAAIDKTTSFILSAQEPNGSWGGVDMTAAAVQALSLVSSFEGVPTALGNARLFLTSKQEEQTGGVENAYSTSWAMQAIAALGESQENWRKNGKTPGDFLFFLQASDGGLMEGDTAANRVWATSYAVPGALQKPWGEILFEFENPGGVSQEPIAASRQESSGQQEVLEKIQQKLNVIEEKVAVLELKVSLVYAEYQLAQKQSQIALLRDNAFFAEGQESNAFEGAAFQELSGEQGNEQDRFAAQASSASDTFFESGIGRILLIAGAGIVLFFLLGGWRRMRLFSRQRSLAAQEQQSYASKSS
ncbi:MAG: hypothetical protein A3D64_00815 [Candidatus Wildermuthbacteria bacterium RIFCSPHIGHO2_02_FULL_49_9]|uniref:Squalene cyclase C-terminal domain-containing protein n=1 Tax=Candidatus Wildermuthbacteria bacterium RIFCSPHIGHO2_02_FULL_49_9 TaxID=1802456 RepID=A0A1G2RDZ6_9BACT|nr:MAG: hypothetical protein A3D64_00815 [Candidatus Wildermuthbacteria bacterium RIFCSPHIGHO2_02_FULL_49_9]